jgi:hypothetical protein
VFTFNNSVTRNALADFMIGIPSAVTQDAPVTALWNSWYGALFAQDDYRISSRLTLNLGLPTVNTAAPVGLLIYGDPGVERGVIPTPWNHVSPRVGIVWDPVGDGKTAIHAAGGLFYGSISGNKWNTTTNYQPWATRLTFTNTSNRTSPTGVPLGASLGNPYTAYPGGPPFPYNGTFVTGGGLYG